MALFQDSRQADAAPYLERAAQRGLPTAQFLYAFMLYTGKGVTQDRVRGRSLMDLAAANGQRQTREALAKMGSGGAYVLPPLSEPMKQRWRERAAAYAREATPAAPAGGAAHPKAVRK